MKVFRKIIDSIFWIIAIVLVVLLLLLGGVRLFGYVPYIITSGSMDPVYPVGSVVYTEKVEFEQLEVGDDISFYIDESTVATHRIREIIQDEEKVQTYGVNNIDADGNQINDAQAVDFDHIVGRVRFSLPMVGYVYRVIGTSSGKAGVMIVILALFTISRILQYLEEKRS